MCPQYVARLAPTAQTNRGEQCLASHNLDCTTLNKQDKDGPKPIRNDRPRTRAPYLRTAGRFCLLFGADRDRTAAAID